ncbi:MAG: tetratricopeptide repeat protein [Elusimicrobiota bacterium]
MAPPDTLGSLEKAADGLIAAGRSADAVRLAFAAAMKVPGSSRAARALERTLSRAADVRTAESLYARLLATGRASSDHHYSLAMFRKRAGDHAGMRAAFEGLLAAPGGAPDIHRYIAFCSLDRYAEAFAAAERISASPPPGEPVLSRLWNPWGDRSTSLPAGFMPARLSALRRASLPAELENYRPFLAGAMLLYMGKPGEALREFSRLRPFRGGSRGWTRFPEGWAALRLRLFGRARDAFSRAAASPISRIQALGRLAEVEICSGRRARGFSLFDKAMREAHFSQLPGLRAWKGQMLLFTGRCAEAEKLLAGAGRDGDDAAWCWRGAALARLGRLREALSELDRAVRLFPTDIEALVWRGEVLRLMGRYRDCAAEQSAVLRKTPGYPWALVNRGLCRLALGDGAGAAEDFRALDAEMKEFLERTVKKAAGESRAERAGRMLEAACRLAMGDRRDDLYFRGVWMRAGKGTGGKSKLYNRSHTARPSKKGGRGLKESL